MPRYTQGLMDLGATVCKRRDPLCSACPVASVCVASLEGRTDGLPGEEPQAHAQDRVVLAAAGTQFRRSRLACETTRPRGSGPASTVCRCSKTGMPLPRPCPPACRARSAMCEVVHACADAQGLVSASASRSRSACMCTRLAEGAWFAASRMAEQIGPAGARPQAAGLATSRAVESRGGVERDPALTEIPGQLLDQEHRAVLPASAADGHGHVAAVVSAPGHPASVRGNRGCDGTSPATSGRSRRNSITGASRPVKSRSADS